MVRMSYPRTLYSPPSHSRSKIGSTSVPPYAVMVWSCARNPIDVRLRMPHVPDTLDARLIEARVPTQTGQLDTCTVAATRGREDRMIHRVVHDGRSDLANGALPGLPEEQRILKEGVS